MKNRHFLIQGTEPKPADFGITAEEYDKLSKRHNPWNTPLQVTALVLAVMLSVVIVVRNRELLDWTFIWSGILIWFGLSVAAAIISDFLPRPRKFRLYEDALATFYRTQEDFWLSLKGESLENVLADLYRKLGYKVESTPRTDDKGIDLWLYKDDKSTIVQCKGHKNPVGPAIVRELFGTLKSHSAESAILVSPAGFTRGAKQAAANKAIQLISSRELIAMAKETE